MLCVCAPTTGDGRVSTRRKAGSGLGGVVESRGRRRKVREPRFQVVQGRDKTWLCPLCSCCECLRVSALACPRTGQVGRNHSGSPAPTSQGHPRTWHSIVDGSGISPVMETPLLSGQPVPVCAQLQSKKNCSHITGFYQPQVCHPLLCP